MDLGVSDVSCKKSDMERPQDMEITLFPHGNDLQIVGFSSSESRLVGGFISPMSLWFLLVIYRTSFHGIINQLITWEGTLVRMLGFPYSF